MVFGVKQFHQYLAGSQFVIHSDHAPLRFSFDATKPVKDRISSRLQRWSFQLSI